MQARSLILFLVFLLASCNGSDEDSAGVASAPEVASPGGIWHGTDSESGLHVLGLIDEAGDMRLIRADNLQYVGTIKVSGGIIVGNIESFTDRGTTFSDGSAHGAGSVSGSLIERQTLRLSIAVQSDNGTASTTSMTFTYDSFYETASSLAVVAGNYVEAIKGTVFVVDESGHFSAQDAVTGCTIDGNVSIIDPDYNIYELSYSYASCGGEAAALNGVAAAGMGIFTEAGLGAQVLAALSYAVAGQKVGLVVELNRH